MSDMVGKDIFTDKGSYCGKVSDVEFDLTKFRVRAVVVDAAKGSYLAGIVGGRRGVIVPYGMVKTVNDVVLIKHIAAPAMEEAPATSVAEKE